MRSHNSIRLTCLIAMLLSLASSLAAGGESRKDHADYRISWQALLGESATRAYIDQIDIERYERRGMDPTRPEMSPLRVGKTLRTLDRVWDYDFVRLEQVSQQLHHVNRRRALAAWFDKLTEGAESDTERHLRVARFLSRALFHNLIQPVYADKTGVYDPLVLLELSEARCGQVARVGCLEPHGTGILAGRD